MLKYYAQLNDNNICIGISQLTGEVENQKLVPIETFDHDKLWRKYENGQWSAEKFEPQSTAPLSEFEQLRADVDQLIISLLEV